MMLDGSVASTMHASQGRARSSVRTLARSLGRALALALAAGSLVHGLAGCTHAGGKPPVDSPIYAFQPADPDDFAGDDDSDTDDSSTDDSGGDDGDSADQD